MPTTANGVPYPASTASPDVPADLQALAAFLDPLLSWNTFTPTISGTGWTLGTGGVITGKWCKIGKTVHFRITHTLGSTGYGTGGLTYSLPTNSNGQVHVGVASFSDVSASARYGGQCPIFTGTCTPFVTPAAAGGADRVVTSTVPVVPAAGDVLTVSGTYEAA